MTAELLHMDCMDFMAGCPANAFELAIVDPPYGINVKTNMGRRVRDRCETGNPVAAWDAAAPPAAYFDELVRVSKNQIIWGANHFISKFAFNPDSRCWLLWDKKHSEKMSFAQFEMAWTSFSGVSKKFDKVPQQPGRIHPTQKPVALYEWILDRYAKSGQTVLDTHFGSASSAIACYNFGCNFIGTEVDPDYYAAASARLAAHQTLKAA